MEFLSAEQYLEKDFADCVEHVNHAKGDVLNENVQRRLFSIWCRVVRGPPPTSPPSSRLSATQLAQYQAWQEITGKYDTKVDAMTAYIALVTKHDPAWRKGGDQEMDKKKIPAHVKEQMKQSGINLVDTSSDDSGDSESSESELDSEDEAKKIVVLPPVKSIFEAARVGRRYQMFLPKHANAIDPETNSSVLMIATDSQQADAVDALLLAGADVNWTDEFDGSTILHCAALLGNERICRALLKAGADPVVKDGDGMTSIQVAKQEGFVKIVQLLTNGA
jgi:acyl-CoA-binding protein